MNKRSVSSCLILASWFYGHLASAELSNPDVFELSLDQLLDMEVTSASGFGESLRDAPAAMIVITRDDIDKRGYQSIGDIFKDLPGFDAMGNGATLPIVAYQRGYRTTGMQRTLIAVNGILDNHLWNHSIQTAHVYPMSSIDRIEVLYGPAGSIYGPNAFLGVINLITQQPEKSADANVLVSVTASENGTRGIDVSSAGSLNKLNYTLGFQYFDTDGADLDDYAPWGFTTERWLNDSKVWGPILQQQANGEGYGNFHDPSQSWAIQSELEYDKTKLGVLAWQTFQSYGLFYTFDHAQPNARWEKASYQYYLLDESDLTNKLSLTTLIKYRENDWEGDWAEATPDWNEGLQAFSYLSISDWDTENSSWKIKQNFDYQVSDHFKLSGGIKYERKDLTKAYDLCSYWSNALCSSEDGSNQGPYELGPGIFHSSDPMVTIGSPTSGHIPANQKIKTTDKGAYLQAGWNKELWSYSASVRWDNNSIYGTYINPRVSAIYHLSEGTTVKAIYGEAFQEGAPQQLYGGWSGRRANPNLAPEEVKNYELILMHEQDNWLHDMSLFYSKYDNVIKEEAENAGTRDVTGFEYRGRYQIENSWTTGGDITGYLYYTWTDSESAITYDHNLGDWIDGDAELGDIAPHKINVGMNIPVSDVWNINASANWVSDRVLYLRNPLREQGIEADNYAIFDLVVSWDFSPLKIKLKVSNLFDKNYYHPGGEQADSGNDFNNRANGFRNSLIPQLGRQWWINFSYRL